MNETFLIDYYFKTLENQGYIKLKKIELANAFKGD
jgi:hypothetical protein